jgi:excisionase family DNA binding protein
MSGNAQGSNSPEKRVYSVDEIAEILDISKGSAYELIREGLFRTVRIGSAIRVSRQSFDDWLDNQNQESEA